MKQITYEVINDLRAEGKYVTARNLLYEYHREIEKKRAEDRVKLKKQYYKDREKARLDDGLCVNCGVKRRFIKQSGKKIRLCKACADKYYISKKKK